MTSIFAVQASNHPIKSVTVFKSSRAEVVRSFNLALKKGQNKIEIRGLSSSIDPHSVRVSGLGQACLFDVVCTLANDKASSYAPDSSSEVTRSLLVKKAALESQRVIREHEYQILLQYAKTLTGEHITPTQMTQFMESFIEQRCKAVDAATELNEQIVKITRDIEVAREKAASKEGKALGQVNIVIFADTETTVALKLTYIVGNVQWIPTYELQATTENGKPSSCVTLHYRARIIQSTGEDWNNVSLILNTNASDSFVDGIPQLKSLKIHQGSSNGAGLFGSSGDNNAAKQPLPEPNSHSQSQNSSGKDATASTSKTDTSGDSSTSQPGAPVFGHVTPLRNIEPISSGNTSTTSAFGQYSAPAASFATTGPRVSFFAKPDTTVPSENTATPTMSPSTLTSNAASFGLKGANTSLSGSTAATGPSVSTGAVAHSESTSSSARLGNTPTTVPLASTPTTAPLESKASSTGPIRGRHTAHPKPVVNMPSGNTPPASGSAFGSTATTAPSGSTASTAPLGSTPSKAHPGSPVTTLPFPLRSASTANSSGNTAPSLPFSGTATIMPTGSIGTTARSGNTGATVSPASMPLGSTATSTPSTSKAAADPVQNPAIVFAATAFSKVTTPSGSATTTTAPFGSTEAKASLGSTATRVSFGITETKTPSESITFATTAPSGSKTATTTTSPFASVTSKSSFGSNATTSPFSTTAIISPFSTTFFGSTSTTSAFGSTGAGSPFGSTTTTSPFGSTATPSLFGSTATASSLGNTTSTAKTSFGTTATTTTPFGSKSTTTPFGSATTTSPFGTTASTSPFGSAPSTGPFGSAGTTASTTTGPFGSTSTTSPFANTGTTSPFGTTSTTSPFGTTASSAPFGTTTTTTPFGVPTISPFGSTVVAAGPFGSTVTSGPFAGTATTAFSGLSGAFSSFGTAASNPFDPTAGAKTKAGDAAAESHPLSDKSKQADRPSPILKPTPLVSERPVALSFSAQGDSTIPSDGIEHQVSIAVLPFNAKVSYVTIPRIDSRVFLQCEIMNTSKYQLLAGPVAVFLDDCYVSKTTINDINMGDRFGCALGVDAATIVTYSCSGKSVKSTVPPSVTFIESTDATTYTTKISVHNKHQFDITDLIVRDIIPTSDDSRVKIILHKPVGLAGVKDGETVDLKNYGLKVGWEPLLDGKGGEKEGKFEWKWKVRSGVKVNLEAEWEIKVPADGANWLEAFSE